eukprot:3681862-Rhodomonas_salina.2
MTAQGFTFSSSSNSSTATGGIPLSNTKVCTQVPPAPRTERWYQLRHRTTTFRDSGLLEGFTCTAGSCKPELRFQVKIPQLNLKAHSENTSRIRTFYPT